MDDTPVQRLTSLAHGGGCGCKLDPGVLTEILGAPSGFPMPKALIVDAATRDDADARVCLPRAVTARFEFQTVRFPRPRSRPPGAPTRGRPQMSSRVVSGMGRSAAGSSSVG